MRGIYTHRRCTRKGGEAIGKEAGEAQRWELPEAQPVSLKIKRALYKCVAFSLLLALNKMSPRPPPPAPD